MLYRVKSLDPFNIPFSGINLIEASAGTGKTYSITSLYIRALVEFNYSIDQILVVTYTEAATKELKDRLLNRIRESIFALESGDAKGDEFLIKLKNNVKDREKSLGKLFNALHSFDEAAIYTIHGFCYQALQEQAFESRSIYGAELIGDDHELVLEIIDDYWRKWVAGITEEPFRRPLFKLMNDKGLTPDSLVKMIGSFVGKPFLEVLPTEGFIEEPEEKLNELQDLFSQLQKLWKKYKDEIFGLLGSEHLGYYRSDWLEGWMKQMDEWLHEEVASIRLFDKFDKFVQSEIDGSLKKSSEKQGIPAPSHPFFKLAEQYRVLAQSFQQFDVQFAKKLLQYLTDELDEKKEKLQVLSFDDLLLKLNKALRRQQRGEHLCSVLRQKYPVALVDEFQDTDPVQYDIFRQIYSEEPTAPPVLFMIGDPKQSIYSFRGADIFTYLQTKQQIEEQNIYSLDRNFRSVPQLINGINTIFVNHTNPFLLSQITFYPVIPGKEKYSCFMISGQVKPPLQIRSLSVPGETLPLNKREAEDRAASDTAKKITGLIQAGRAGEAVLGEKSVKAEDIAVLVRSHRQAQVVSDALKKQNIKSVQYSQEAVFDSEEVEELEYILRAIAEPVNESRIKTALATRLMGYDGPSVFQLQEDETEWISRLEEFDRWHQAWLNHGFSFMFQSWLKHAAVSQRIIRYNNGERILTNLLHLGELLQAEEQKNSRGPRGLLKWLAQKRKEKHTNSEEEQLRLESDEQLVKIVTMHRSKGLEYPIVFCPFLWYAPEYNDKGGPLIFHDQEDPSKAYLDLGGKKDVDRGQKRYKAALEDLAESVRLAYVAMTRAQQQCFISWVPAKKSEYSALGYLLLEPQISLSLLNDTISPDKKYYSVDPEIFNESLTNLIDKSSGSIDLVQSSSDSEGTIGLRPIYDDLKEARRFRRHPFLDLPYHITSFSGLVSFNDDNDFAPEDKFSFDERYSILIPEDSGKKRTIFSFPKGPQPGTCIHSIFEEIAFNNPGGNPQDLITQSLDRYSINQNWVPVVYEMLKTVIHRSLDRENTELKLANLKENDFVSEMEFHYRSDAVTVRELLSIIRPGLKKTSNVISGESAAGFMKGFIDLTFRYEDKFYVLDYKTNHLGNCVGDYDEPSLQKEIKEAMYDLQYHIYIIALHRFLSLRYPDYQYKRDFGGVYYLFVRGMNSQGHEGIYYDKPSEETIDKLNKYLSGGANGTI